jgi:hypothetical protein
LGRSCRSPGVAEWEATVNTAGRGQCGKPRFRAPSAPRGGVSVDRLPACVGVRNGQHLGNNTRRAAIYPPKPPADGPVGSDLTAPSGLIPIGNKPRVNPGLCFLGHFGPKIGMSKLQAPKGQEDSAQGFNPGNPPPRRCALKGRQIRRGKIPA